MSKIGKSIEMKLPCVLTERELQSRSMMLVETISTIDETIAAKASSAKAFNETLTGLAEQQRDLARTLKSGVEERMIPCTVLFHTPAEASKRIVRMDTGEVVKEEAMTAAECQLNMFAAQQDFERFMQEQTAAQPGDDIASGDSPAPDPEPDAPSGRPKRPRTQ